MIIGSISENKDLEKRISITPEIAKKYLNLGFEVKLSENYGEHLGFKGKFGPLYSYGVELINRYKPTWFVAENVGGIVISEQNGEGYQASQIQALTTHPFGVGDSGFRVGMNAGEVDTVPYGFFKKTVFPDNWMLSYCNLRSPKTSA